MKYDNSISIIRVSAMLMIVAFHCLCYNAGIWSLGNPITYNNVGLDAVYDLRLLGLDFFVLISGLLYYRIDETGKYDDTKRFLNNKFKRLLVPYIVWGLMLCVIFYGHQNPKDILYGISHLWFLLMLFDVFVIMALTKKIWKKQNLKGSLAFLLALILIGGVVAKINIKFQIMNGRILFGLQQALDYLPIFYVGILIEKFKVYKKIVMSKYTSLIVMLILILVTMALCRKSLHLARIHNWILPSFFFALLYSTLKRYSVDLHGKSRSLLMLLDMYSLAIYIVHHILIFVYLDYIPNSKLMMTEHYYLMPLLMFLVLIPLSLLISVALSYLPGSKYIIGISLVKDAHK